MMRIFAQSIAILFMFATGTANAEKAPEAVSKVVPDIKTLASNPVIVEAVKAQNTRNISIDEIKKRDAEWQSTTGVDDFMKGLLNNAAAKEMLKFEKTKPYYTELFLMDNQGANVAMTNKTSDYWQGDEAKWQKSFDGGKGSTHLGDVKFDDSAQAYLVQVSLPVMDGDKAIGAITVGINLDVLEK